MKYALFLGCKIPYYLPAYETATRRLAVELNIDLTDEPDFICCGYPMRDLYFESYVLSAARNLALAGRSGLAVMTPCKCCFGSFKTAAFMLAENPQLMARVNDKLAEEGLRYDGAAEVKHLSTVLDQDFDWSGEEMKNRLVRKFDGLKVAVLYGCHALRPSKMTGYDNPREPRIVDRLVGLTGATSLDWAGKLSCCGDPLRGKNDALASGMIAQRLAESHQAGADLLAVGCTHSAMQAIEGFRAKLAAGSGETVGGLILYPQLLGLSLGIEPAELGLSPADPESEYIFSVLNRPPEAPPEE